MTKTKLYNRRFIAFFTAILVTAGLQIANAGTTQTSDPKELAAPATAPTKSAISGDFGVSVLNEYVERGLVLVNHGAVIQPYADLKFDLYDGDGFINSVTPSFGIWSDVNSNTGHGTSTPGSTINNWYEFDYTPGVTIGFAKRWAFTGAFSEYVTPSGGEGGNMDNLNATLNFNDAGLIDPSKNFSLQPHFTWLGEVGGKSSPGLKKHGNYFELGLAPNYTILKGAEFPITFTVPLTVGLGDSKFYNGDTYGYFCTGLMVSTPLAFIPKAYGDWNVAAGYKYYNLGDQAATVNSVSKNQNVFSFSVGCAF